MTTIDYAEFDIEAAGGSDAYRACLDCDRPMRPNWLPLTAHPGTVPHSAHGVCATCRTRRAVAARKNPPVEPPHLDLARITDQWLAAYIAGRRLRGVPAEGWAA